MNPHPLISSEKITFDKKAPNPNKTMFFPHQNQTKAEDIFFHKLPISNHVAEIIKISYEITSLHFGH